MDKQNKTTETNKSVNAFIKAVNNATKREDSFQLVEIFKTLTGFDPKMWGPSIIGFGTYHYKYESGREGDAPLAAFSPRKDAIVLYFSTFDKREQMLEKLGKHKTTKGCVYIKKLDDVDVVILKKMISACIKHTKSLYP